MTKKDLIRSFAEKTGRTITETKTFIDEFEEFVVETGKVEDEIALGIGKFKFTTKPEHIGKNPKDGTPVTVPEKRSGKFKSGKALKDVK